MKGVWRDILEAFLEAPVPLGIVYIALNTGKQDIDRKEILIMLACILVVWIIGYAIVRVRNMNSSKNDRTAESNTPQVFDKKATKKDIFKALDFPAIFVAIVGVRFLFPSSGEVAFKDVLIPFIITFFVIWGLSYLRRYFYRRNPVRKENSWG